jgi:hypothetical protein
MLSIVINHCSAFFGECWIAETTSIALPKLSSLFMYLQAEYPFSTPISSSTLSVNKENITFKN